MFAILLRILHSLWMGAALFVLSVSTPQANALFNFKDYTIQIDYRNVPLFDQWIYFRASALRWAHIITKDVIDVKDDRLPTYQATDCGVYPSIVDDVYVCVSYRGVDGPGGVVGAGYATLYRQSYLPITGVLYFDKDDVPLLRKAGVFRSTILNEMGNVLGINSFVWNSRGLTGATTASPPCPYKYLSNATQQWRDLTSCNTAVPVETSFPSDGQAQCNHWDEDCLLTEIMTPRVNAEWRTLSRITVGTLQDIGYVVDYEKADKFTNVNDACLCRPNVQTSGTRGKAPFRRVTETDTPQKKRTLSESGAQAAWKYGQALIQKNLVTFQEQQSNHAGESSSKNDIIVGRAAVVLYHEAGEVYTVTVTV